MIGAKTERPAAAHEAGNSPVQTEGGIHAPAAALITPDQVLDLETLCSDAGIKVDDLKRVAKIERLALLTADRYDGCVTWIHKQAAIREVSP